MTIDKEQFAKILTRMKTGSSFSRDDLINAQEFAVEHDIDDLKLKTLKKIFLKGADRGKSLGQQSRH